MAGNEAGPVNRKVIAMRTYNIMTQVRFRRAYRKFHKSVPRYVGIAALFASTGCAAFNPEGFEFGAKLGMYAVDQKTESQSTTPQCGGLMGMLRGCQTPAPKQAGKDE